MNIFEYLDNLLFGPTLQFVASTKYSLDNAVQRLRAAVIPRFSLAGIFRAGLKGTVRPKWVCLRWKKPWSDNGFRPMFHGSFVSDARGVLLVGQIGVPVWQKAASGLLIPIATVAYWIFWQDRLILPILVSVAMSTALVVGFILQFIVLRVFHRNDYQLIADALDNALS
jgi:hypothetical protein